MNRERAAPRNKDPTMKTPHWIDWILAAALVSATLSTAWSLVGLAKARQQQAWSERQLQQTEILAAARAQR